MAIAVTFGVVFWLNRSEGFRPSQKPKRPYESLTDTVEAMAIGLVCSALLLWLLQELKPETQLYEALGKVIFESVPFTIGVALANQLK